MIIWPTYIYYSVSCATRIVRVSCRRARKRSARVLGTQVALTAAELECDSCTPSSVDLSPTNARAGGPRARYLRERGTDGPMTYHHLRCARSLPGVCSRMRSVCTRVTASEIYGLGASRLSHSAVNWGSRFFITFTAVIYLTGETPSRGDEFR